MNASRLLRLKSLQNALKSSVLYKNSNANGLLCLRSPFSTSNAVSAGGFTKDFKPGPYPTTEEERVAAAKKYGMLPSDYKPFPDDGSGFGDYPQLPEISADMKSDWEDWDDPIGKRNFAEPVFIAAEQVTIDKVTLKELPFSRGTITLLLILVATTWFGLNYLADPYKMTIPIKPKQYPRQVESGEEKHYKI